MRIKTIKKIFLLIFLLESLCIINTSNSLLAMNPDEALTNPKLELRARNLSKELRCMVCQNQSIDDSDADLAKDLRREVRKRIKNGETNNEIKNFLVSKYGDFILLKPPFNMKTLLLWLSPILIIILGIIFIRNSQITSRNTKFESNEKNIISLTKKNNVKFNYSTYFFVFSISLILSSITYFYLGKPNLSDQPLNARKEEINLFKKNVSEQKKLNQNILKEVQQQLSENPNNIQALLTAALIYSKQKRFSKEVEILERVVKITNGDIRIKSMLAEAYSKEANGIVTLPAIHLLNEILDQDPLDPRGLYLIGLAEFQNEKYLNALEYWITLKEKSSIDAPWNTILNQNIKEAAIRGNIDLDTISSR